MCAASRDDEALGWREVLQRTYDDERLSRSEARALTAWLEAQRLSPSRRRALRSEAFRFAGEQAVGKGVGELLGWLEGVLARVDAAMDAQEPKAPAAAQVWFGPGPDCLTALLEAWRRVRERADVCVFTITDDRLTREMESAVRRGVRVRIVTDDAKRDDLGSDVDRLRAAGAAVALDAGEAHMHHKFAVFDRRQLVTGSFNWTRSASEVNAENLVVTDDPRLVGAFEAEFERLWAALGDLRPRGAGAEFR
ncbi:MAG: phospholipase D-like domain-containing protein [Planctomycetota bacterium]